MERDEDFIAFAAARWSTLYRLAYLLTASAAAAEDLLQTSLEKAYVAWPRISTMDAPDAYVRKLMVNALVSDRRRKGARAEVLRDRLRRRAPRPRSAASWTTSSCGRWSARCPPASGPSSCSATTRTSPSGRPPTSSAARSGP